MFRSDPVKLLDCHQHGPASGAELFIVEGDSAAKHVARVRDDQFQAVLPMQGKPLNAWKASRNSVGANALYGELIAALGCGWDQSFQCSELRYQRVMLLFDPDADGIHCGALTVMFFFRWLRPLIETGRIHVVRAPLGELTAPGRADRVFAYSEQHLEQLRRHLRTRGIDVQTRRYRGLASINPDALAETCVDPHSRHATVVSSADAEAAIGVFGG